MARNNVPYPSFSYGEISPRMLGRIDITSLYRQALRECVNWLPDRTGSLRFRAGTQYTGTLGVGANRRLSAISWNNAPAILELRVNAALVHYTASPSTGRDVFDLFDRESNIVALAGLNEQMLREAQIVIEPYTGDAYRPQNIYVLHPFRNPIKLSWGSNLLVATTALNDVFRDAAGRDPPRVGSNVAAAAFFEQRIVLGGSPSLPDMLVGSRSPDPSTGLPRYTEWTLAQTISNVVTVLATHAFLHPLPSDQREAIRWMVRFGEVVVVGCDRGLFMGRELHPDTPPLIRLHGAIGCSWVQPVVVPFGVLFVGVDRKRIYEAIKKRDLTAYADHLFERDLIKQIAWQQNPIPRLWVLTESGKVRCLTIDENTGVMAWSRMEFDGVVKSIACSYGDEEGSALWMALQRGSRDLLEGLIDPTDHRHDGRCYLDSSVVRTTDANGDAAGVAHITGRVTVQQIHDDQTGIDDIQATTTAVVGDIP